jgi:hypothetical protein
MCYCFSDNYYRLKKYVAYPQEDFLLIKLITCFRLSLLNNCKKDFQFHIKTPKSKFNKRLKRLCLILLFIIFRKYISTAMQPFSMRNINWKHNGCYVLIQVALFFKITSKSGDLSGLWSWFMKWSGFSRWIWYDS